jgi:hypothetical protein
MPFPGPADSYPPTQPVADYLEAYAEAFNYHQATATPGTTAAQQP